VPSAGDADLFQLQNHVTVDGCRRDAATDADVGGADQETRRAIIRVPALTAIDGPTGKGFHISG
jgi:hypothetical protein